MMKRSEEELKLPPPSSSRTCQPADLPAAHGARRACVRDRLVGNSPIIDNGIGLATDQDNTSLILFRLIAFATLPMIVGSIRRGACAAPLDRVTLQPLFYAQCFATTPVVLLCSIASTRLAPAETAANIAADLMLVGGAVFYIGSKRRWFALEAKRGRLTALWALRPLPCPRWLAAMALLFSRN